MNERAELNLASGVARHSTVSRSNRLEAILGRDWRIALPFVLPIVLIMAGLILWPFINAILLSFTTRSLVTRTEQFVGLANYQRLFQDADFLSAVSNTLVFTFASIAVKFVIGMGVALLLHSRLPFRSVLSGV